MAARTRFRLIVFDWDGTLADSAATIAEAIRMACADLGLTVPSEEAARYVIGLGLTDALRHVAPGLPPERYPELSERYRRHYFLRDADIPLFGGVADLLATLEARGTLLAVATGKSRRGLDRAIERSGIGRRFVATRCADEGFPKPHPDMLLHLMARTGSGPDETLMIGDTTHDMDLARNAGSAALAVTYGAHPAPALAARGPVASVGSVAELADWLAAHG